MINFKCVSDSCVNKDVEYNFLGYSEFAECGGCKTNLIGYNPQPDPELQQFVTGDSDD
jgi:hypothetical protein